VPHKPSDIAFLLSRFSPPPEPAILPVVFINSEEHVMTSIASQFSVREVRQVLGGVFGGELHSKRIDSLSGATVGVLHSASLAVAAIGHGLAAARGVESKHAVKQVDRLLSNPGIKVDEILALWVPFVVGARTSIVVAMDWTDFDADNQATIMLSLVTDHGRATPLVWLTLDKTSLNPSYSPPNAFVTKGAR
jgi:hypothetical protein